MYNLYKCVLTIQYNTTRWNVLFPLAVKHSCAKVWKYFSKEIFDTGKEVKPHVLLRDYARNTLEYILYLKLPLELDVIKIRPPYKSKFPFLFPTNKFIDLLIGSPNSNMIVQSMTTEYGT